MGAISAGDLAAAQAAIDQGADVNCPIQFSTALMAALYEPNHAIVEFLLAQPTLKLDQMGEYSSPMSAALMGAARAGDRRWVDRLFELGADPHWVNKFGQTALLRCVAHFPNELEWMQRLACDRTVAPKAAVIGSNQPIYVAMKHDHADAYVLLTSHGAKIDEALLVAATQGASDIVSRLVAGHEAKELGSALRATKSVEVARLLLDAGADIDEVDEQGHSALYASSARGATTLCEFLLERGASLTEMDAQGQGLGFSLVSSTIAVGELLLSQRVDLCRLDKRGNSIADECRAMLEVVTDVQVPFGGDQRNYRRQRREISEIVTEYTEMLGWLRAHGVPSK